MMKFMCDLSDRRQLDFINLMAYDLHGPWERVTGHYSGLYAHSDESGPQRFLNTVGDVVFFLCNVIDNYFEVEPALSTALFTSYFFAKSQATVFFCQTRNYDGTSVPVRASLRACVHVHACVSVANNIFEAFQHFCFNSHVTNLAVLFRCFKGHIARFVLLLFPSRKESKTEMVTRVQQNK